MNIFIKIINNQYIKYQFLKINKLYKDINEILYQYLEIHWVNKFIILSINI